MLVKRTYKHFGFCCGLGFGAAGFNDSSLQIANMLGNWRCIGGVDIDAAGLADFEEFTGTKGTLLDLFTREQYIAFHGEEPPAGWREATLDDIRRAAGNEDPDGVFISSPCKGASGLLPESMSITPKYMALNELTLRCVWLMLEAWQHRPVKLIVFENVPRLASRGRYLLDQIVQLFRHYGYWKRAPGAGPLSSSLLDAGTWDAVAALQLANDGYLLWPKPYIDIASRPVVPAAQLNHKQALRAVGLKLPKIKRERLRRYYDRINCHGCGRFLTERQRFEDCPNCGASNAP